MGRADIKEWLNGIIWCIIQSLQCSKSRRIAI